MSYSTYLGPYFECTDTPKTTRANIFGCGKEACAAYVGSETNPYDAHEKFCAKCGSAHRNVRVSRAVHVDVVELFGDQMSARRHDLPGRADKVIVIPNIQRKGEPRADIDMDGDYVIDMSEVDTRAEMAWLETAFAPELRKLRKAFAKVETKWGAFSYWI